MGILDDILARAQQFGYRAETAAPGGPWASVIDKLPQNLQGPAKIATYIPSRQADLVDLGLDTTGAAGKMLTGLGYVTGPTNNDPTVQAARAAFDNPANGDIFQRYLAANEGAASKNSVMTGILNMALDPSNLLTPLGEATGVIDKTPLYAKQAVNKGDLLKAIMGTGKLAAQEAFAAQRDAMAGKNIAKLGLKTLYSDWKSSLVNRMRNSGVQDVGFNIMNAKTANLPLSEVANKFISMQKAAEFARKSGTPLSEVMPDSTNFLLHAIGQEGKYDSRLVGLGALESGSHAPTLSPGTSAALQSLYGLLTPRPGVPLLGTVADAAFGYLRPAHNEFYSALGHIAQTPFRASLLEHGAGTALEDAGKAFLKANPSLAAELTAKSAINRQAATKLGFNLPTVTSHGLFSPKDVETAMKNAWPKSVVNKATRDAVMKQWDDMAYGALQHGGQFAKDSFGDFSNQTAGQKAADVVIPFLSWVRVAYPSVFKMLIKNPTVAAQVAQETQVSQAKVSREGLPSWVTGTVPVGTDAPFGAGLIARGLLGGREGVANVNPLNVFTPVGVDATGLADMASGNTKPFQKAEDVLGLLGVAGVNPVLGDLAYAGGLTDKAPGPMTAYSGLEQAAPGGNNLPSLLNGVLNAARKLGGNSQISDPYVTAAKEMVFERTKKPVEDPSNKQYALDIEHKTGIYQDAKAAVDAGGAFRSAFQYINPTNVSTTTDTSAQYDKSKVGEQQLLGSILASAGLGSVAGMSQADIGNIDPALAQQVYAVKQNVAGANPLHNLYANPQLSALDKQDPRLTQWQLQHMQLRLAFPAIYQAQELAYMAALGIPGKPGAEPGASKTKPSSSSAPLYWPKVR
jgi:hypothetical protein